MKCYLCDSTSFNLIKKGVRDNNDISVLSCNNCDLVFLDSFNHIDKIFTKILICIQQKLKFLIG